MFGDIRRFRNKMPIDKSNAIKNVHPEFLWHSNLSIYILIKL